MKGISLAIGMFLVLSGLLSSSIVLAHETGEGRGRQTKIFKPQGSPQKTVGGGSRNGQRCSGDPVVQPKSSNSRVLPASIKALLPQDFWGKTVAMNPTILIYIPETVARKGILTLEDKRGNGVYQTTVSLPKGPGVVGITLPSEATKLKLDQDYHWIFAIVCRSKGPDPRDPYVEGLVRRVEPDIDLKNRLAKALPQEKALLYAEKGIWYDAIANLLLLEQTKDPKFMPLWTELLESVGLAAIAPVPVELLKP